MNIWDMKTNSNFVLRTIIGQNVLVAEGVNAVNMSSIIHLNDSAAYLWTSVQGKEFTVETLRDLLLERYEVDEATAAADAAKVAQTWEEYKLLQ